jgi:nitroreductase
MEFSHSIIEIIKKRKSVRTYLDCAIDEALISKLEDAVTEVNEQMKCKGRIALLKGFGNDAGVPQKLGTYGFITGAKTFLIGIIDKEENNALEFGYWFEKIILHATDLNLGTCWLGGTFKRDDFIKAAELKDGEVIAVVSPVGKPKEKKRVLESAMRAAVGADKRKLWPQLFFESTCMKPLLTYQAGAYEQALEMVRLSPSASNKQPWRVLLKDNAYHFFLCKTKGYPQSIYDMQKNDIGIAMCHFELTAKELGLRGSWKEIKDIEASEVLEYMISWLTEE